MKLWLDDLGPTPDPDDPDKRVRPVPAGWTHAKTVRDAQKLIEEHRGDFEAASLDHDLGDKLQPCYACETSDGGKDCEDCHCHTRPSTGCDLAHWMAASGNWPKLKPASHSANPSGSKDINGIFERYGPYAK